MRKKTKIQYPIVVRFFDKSEMEITEYSSEQEGEYREFVSVAAAKKWLKEPTQVEWLHSYEIEYTIYKVVPI